MKIYVSTTGSDKNDGTKQSPISSLDHALKLIRDINTNQNEKNQEIKVQIKAGSYQFQKTLEFSEEVSGSQENPIQFIAKEKNSVFITGAVEFGAEKSHFIKESEIISRVLPHLKKKIRVIDLKSVGIQEFGDIGPRGFRRPYIPAWTEIFIDSKPLNIAQWPNKGEPSIPIGKIVEHGTNQDDIKKGSPQRPGSFHYETNRPDRWKKAKSIWISGFFHYGFADDTVQIKEIDFEKKIFHIRDPHMYGYYSGKPFQTWYALNLIEEIEHPGEYSIDFQSGRIYFYPPEDFSENSRISISTLKEPLLALENSSFVSFENITFENSRGLGVYIEKGENIQFKGCTFRNFGIVAACIGKGISPNIEYTHDFSGKPISRGLGSWHEHIYANTGFNREAGQNHLIFDCEIYNTGAGGISLGGGDRKSLIPASNRVERCQIYSCNRLDRTYRAPINIDGVGNIIRQCTIHDAPGSAIYLHGNNHIIENNEVFDVMNDGDDMGAFYFGRDPSEFGTIIRNNYWHHIGWTDHSFSNFCLYFDDASCGITVENNLFYKAGKSGSVFIGGGSYFKMRGNIFIDCPIGIRIDDRSANWAKSNLLPDGLFKKRFDVVKIEESPYKDQYPELAKFWEDEPAVPKNEIDQNLFIGKGKKFKGSKKWAMTNNYIQIKKLKRQFNYQDPNDLRQILEIIPKIDKNLPLIKSEKWKQYGLEKSKEFNV
jgi:Right handed beta helix region